MFICLTTMLTKVLLERKTTRLLNYSCEYKCGDIKKKNCGPIEMKTVYANQQVCTIATSQKHEYFSPDVTDVAEKIKPVYHTKNESGTTNVS